MMGSISNPPSTQKSTKYSASSVVFLLLFLGLIGEPAQAGKTIPSTPTKQENTPESPQDPWSWEQLPASFRNTIQFTDTTFQEIVLQYFREKALEIEIDENSVTTAPATTDPLTHTEPAPTATATTEPSAPPTVSLQTLAQPDQLDFMELAGLIHDFATTRSYFEQGVQTIRALYTQYDSHIDQSIKLEYRHLEADLLGYTRNFVESYALFKEIHPLIEDQDLKARNLSQMGYIASERGKYNEAAEYLFAAAQIFSALDQPSDLAITYNRIGLLYRSMNDHETATEYHQKHIDTAEALADSSMMINAYSNMGVLKMESKEFEEAIRYYELAYEIADQLQLPSDIARVSLNIGNVYNTQGNHEEALTYYEQSLAICEEIDLQYGIILNKLNIGQAYFLKGDYLQSEPNLNVAYQYLKERNIQKDLRIVTKYLYETYQNLGQLERSIELMTEYIDLSAELYDIEKTELTEDLRFRYETDLKDKQILLAEADARENKAANRTLTVISLLLMVMMSGSVAYYKHRNRYLRTLYERNVEVIGSIGVDQERVEAKASRPVEDKEDKRNRELYERIKKAMVEEKLFKDSDLQLSKLSRHVQTNERYVSQAITTSTGMYYNQFVNFHRISEAKRLILQGEESIAEIQDVCGFNAKSTFYLAFKKSTGMSPAQFLDQHRQEKMASKKAQNQEEN